MGKLIYDKITEDLNDYENSFLSLRTYEITNLYDNEKYKKEFLMLKTNVVDMDLANVTKCVQGTEQDFAVLMNKAHDYIDNTLGLSNSATGFLLLDLFSDCVFGYYVLTPLIEAKEISDIKVYSWDHVTVKINGERFNTNVKFASPDDYDKWLDRIMRIHRLKMDEYNSLQHCTDRRGIKDFYLRIDLELRYIVSSNYSNIHIRKIPKEKYDFKYLKDAGMLDEEIDEYLKDRILNQYSFILSGKGGSGKTSLLNYMVDYIPYNESIFIAQESDELYSDVRKRLVFHRRD